MRFHHRVVSIVAVSATLAIVLLSPASVIASEFKPVNNNSNKLGIGTTFGRWPDGVVRWAYNPGDDPSNEPPDIFSDNTYFVSLLQEAMAELEGSSGLHFEYQGLTNAEIATVDDGVVTIGWEDIGGAAGQAGPAYSCTPQDIIDNGYCPYSDGTGRFNNNGAAVTWDTGVTDFTERKFLQVATHEFMHLVGIGHSDIAESIMYADPYTNLQHLRPDDTEALQAMYGPPDTAVYASVYTPPGAGASPLEDSYISFNDAITTPITTIDGSEASATVGLLWRVPNGHTDDLTVVVTDPSGHFYNGRVDDRDCTPGPGFSCLYWLSFANMSAVVLYPGVWTVYGIMNGDLITTESVTVTTSPTFNEAPDSTLVHDVIRGPAPLTVKLTLSVSGDNEGDDVDATWHIPGTGEIHLDSGDFPGSVGTHSQTVTFDEPGDYEIYVEVNDDWTRYGSGGSAAGPGYRTLYRRVVRVTKASDDITAFEDVTGDGIPDFAVFIGGPNTKPQINVYSGANGQVHANIKYLTTKHRGIAMATVRDADQDETDHPAVAVLTDHDTYHRIYVETRRLDTGASLGKIKFLNAQWRAVDIAVIDDTNGDGLTDDTSIAVLSQRIADGRIRVEIRDLTTGALLRNIIYLNRTFIPIAIGVVDRTPQVQMGTISPLLGVLAENPTDGRRLLQSRFVSSGSLDQNIRFYNSQTSMKDVTVLHDTNGDGMPTDPSWQVLAIRDNDNAIRVQTRLAIDGSLDSNLQILNSQWEALRMDSIGDMNSNTSSEMAISLIQRSDDRRRIHVKDYGSGSSIINVYP